jgi:hypothetical protein
VQSPVAARGSDSQFIAAARTLLPLTLKAIEEVRELHGLVTQEECRCSDWPRDHCHECSEAWPCETCRILDAFLEEVKI